MIGKPVLACVFLTDRDDCLYLGKLAVRETMRGHGLARQLVDLAADRARSKGFSVLELNTRIELIENHRTFQRLGFDKVRDGRHPGFDCPTYIVMRKTIGA